jgi:hypothetical protein
MVRDSPDTMLALRARELDAALSQLEQALDGLAPDADPDAAADALATPVANFDAAAKEALA